MLAGGFVLSRVVAAAREPAAQDRWKPLTLDGNCRATVAHEGWRDKAITDEPTEHLVERIKAESAETYRARRKLEASKIDPACQRERPSRRPQSIAQPDHGRATPPCALRESWPWWCPTP